MLAAAAFRTAWGKPQLKQGMNEASKAAWNIWNESWSVAGRCKKLQATIWSDQPADLLRTQPSATLFSSFRHSLQRQAIFDRFRFSEECVLCANVCSWYITLIDGALLHCCYLVLSSRVVFWWGLISFSNAALVFGSYEHSKCFACNALVLGVFLPTQICQIYIYYT